MKDVNVNGNYDQWRDDIEYFRAMYESSIKYLDELVTDLIESVEDETTYETTVIVTADHGENLAYPEDEYLLGHTGSLSDSLLHVPLLVFNPPSEIEINGEYVSHLDLGRMSRAFAKENSISISRNQAPCELVGMGLDAWTLDSEQQRYWNRVQRCVYTPDRKYRWDSVGSNSAITLDDTKKGVLDSKEDNIEIPEEILSHFGVEIERFARNLNEPLTGRSVGHAVQDRLQELGYL
jgi:membrane-anchored protein YejM (alkaline phosphatase superfamily)